MTSPVASASASAAVSKSAAEKALEAEKTRTEIDKLRKESEKLQQETSNLGKFAAYASGFGGLAGAMVALALWWLGHRVTKDYNARYKDAEAATQKRHQDMLERDHAINREQHNLKLFAELSSQNPRMQVAAAIVILNRLAELRQATAGTHVALERGTLRNVLAAVLKRDASNSVDRKPFFKTVGEGLAKDVGALDVDGRLRAKSPLGDWDFQQVVLADVYWRYVDARGIDFFKADFHKASLRDGQLQGAIFYEADLTDAKLNNADLSSANLSRANLEGADLSGATLNAVILSDARFDDRTKWPDGFSAERALAAGARNTTSLASDRAS